jgi:hypothetical protein
MPSREHLWLLRSQTVANQAGKSAKVWLVACLQNSWAGSFGQNGGGFQFDLRLMMNVKILKAHAS